MVRAVEGMVIEQNSIVKAFGLTVFFLAANLIGTYGIMMTFDLAVACSVVTIVGMAMWLQYSLRIYNRFKYKTPENAFDDLARSSAMSVEDDDSGLAVATKSDLEGYLTMNERSKLGNKWKRRYCVLKRGALTIYEEQNDYFYNTKKPLNIRPITFEGYFLDDHISDEALGKRLKQSTENIFFMILLLLV
jgi:hypothetical protein